MDFVNFNSGINHESDENEEQKSAQRGKKEAKEQSKKGKRKRERPTNNKISKYKMKWKDESIKDKDDLIFEYHLFI
ncbi:hypothetical protein RhiirC2_769335 [Rhizophagus irregularis]|uniref:Uncharacterized protein n=1 Tax=Rhizophagus irregularis TaxID=588596 RepID=A0A2N1NZC5_9GLOM|nr:hypothetical protein RhiirC2_769335 [Rhizophagus irregularis]